VRGGPALWRSRGWLPQPPHWLWHRRLSGWRRRLFLRAECRRPVRQENNPKQSTKKEANNSPSNAADANSSNRATTGRLRGADGFRRFDRFEDENQAGASTKIICQLSPDSPNAKGVGCYKFVTNEIQHGAESEPDRFRVSAREIDCDRRKCVCHNPKGSEQTALCIFHSQATMRLTSQQCAKIREIVEPIAGRGSGIFVFGSRVDEAKRGGDVDLIIETDDHLDPLRASRIHSRLEANLQLPFDIFPVRRGSVLSPFQSMARASLLP